jgi:F-type H+-transporting ATPase subunit b
MRARLVLILGLSLSPALFAQQSPSETPQPGATAQPGGGSTESPEAGKWTAWMWANFAILAGGLYFLLRKPTAAFFAGRSESIKKDIAESKRLREEAEKRLAEMDRRLGALGVEIDKLRTEIRAEFAHDGERIRKETGRRLARLQQQAEQQIESIGRDAREQLRSHAAKLAIDMAEQRLRERIDAGAQQRLVDGFVHSIDRQPPQPEARA